MFSRREKALNTVAVLDMGGTAVAQRDSRMALRVLNSGIRAEDVTYAADVWSAAK